MSDKSIATTDRRTRPTSTVIARNLHLQGMTGSALLDFDIPTGHVTALTGPAGHLAALAIAGRVPITAGTLWIGSHHTHQTAPLDPDLWERLVAFVDIPPIVDPHGPAAPNLSRPRYEERLRMLGLDVRWDTFDEDIKHSILAIMAALANNPDLLVVSFHRAGGCPATVVPQVLRDLAEAEGRTIVLDNGTDADHDTKRDVHHVVALD